MGDIKRRQLAIAALLVVLIAGAFAWEHWRPHARHERAQAHTSGTPSGSAVPSSSTSSPPVGGQQPLPGSGGLADKAQQQAKALDKARTTVHLTMATFNTLGASHTSASGKDPGMASGATRGGWAGQLLLSNRADVVALQEFQRAQASSFERAVGSTYAVWPGTSMSPSDGENSVAWRRDRFDLVRTVPRYYPYFYGRPRLFPLVLLRDKKNGTEFWVTSYHNPANTAEFGNQEHWKKVALSREIPDINALIASTKLPVIVAGDMNDREGFFCPMVGGTTLHAANGGASKGASCQMPQPHWIDWILGSQDVDFTGYRWDHDGSVQRTSDHPIVITQAAVRRGAGQPGGASATPTPPAG